MFLISKHLFNINVIYKNNNRLNFKIPCHWNMRHENSIHWSNGDKFIFATQIAIKWVWLSWTSSALQEHGKIERSKLFLCSKQGDCKKELYLGTLFSIKLSCFFWCFPQEAMSSYFGKTPFLCFWQWSCGNEPWNLFSTFSLVGFVLLTRRFCACVLNCYFLVFLW